VEVIAMRRLGVIVALGALLSMVAGVVTASPALARDPKWQFVPGQPFSCRVMSWWTYARR
jgi:hypothetical protein